MANPSQKASVAPKVLPPEQCPGCPAGNSLPLVDDEDTCYTHSSTYSGYNGADINVY